MKDISLRMAVSMRRFSRAVEYMHDSFSLFLDAELRELGREWDPDTQNLLLTDEDREAMDARALGRTLEEIDEL